MVYRYRKIIGALVFDAPRYIKYLRRKECDGIPYWNFIRNRDEKIIKNLDYRGIKCDWKWTSDLYLPKIFPAAGKRLFANAFADHPVKLENSPPRGNTHADISFIIGHRGLDRAPLLLKTLESIAGQESVNIECIVVEQDESRLVEKLLPNWVKYIHTPLMNPTMPYSRSWAFNVGAESATSKILVLHDNDMLIPKRYAETIMKLIDQGSEVVNLKRFVFYLTKETTKKYLKGNVQLKEIEFDAIVQNLEGGGSFGIVKSAYNSLGGFDEGFVGWGGEDNEFWERAETKNIASYGSMPIIHLWHPAQLEKSTFDKSMGGMYYKKLSKVSPKERIRQLHKSK